MKSFHVDLLDFVLKVDYIKLIILSTFLLCLLWMLLPLLKFTIGLLVSKVGFLNRIFNGKSEHTEGIEYIKKKKRKK